jgi:O-antigen ligase
MSKNIKMFLYVVLPFIALIYVNDDFVIFDRNAIGNSFETISPRFSELIKGEESGDLAEDKSWLIRELMLTKTIEIFSDYPILGIGYDHFKAYDAKLGSMADDKFYRLRNDSKDYLNTRSSHNSYAEYLANTGIIGFFFLFSFSISIFNNYFKGLFINSGELILIIIGGFIGAAIHGYAITAFTGANFWLLMGISAGFFKSNNTKSYAVNIP